jgi:hypothetical protein
MKNDENNLRTGKLINFMLSRLIMKNNFLPLHSPHESHFISILFNLKASVCEQMNITTENMLPIVVKMLIN